MNGGAGGKGGGVEWRELEKGGRVEWRELSRNEKQPTTTQSTVRITSTSCDVKAWVDLF